MVKLMLDYGADVNLRTRYDGGELALNGLMAMGLHDLRYIKVLVEAGADLNLITHHCFTFRFEHMDDYQQICQYLISQGFDLTKLTKH